MLRRLLHSARVAAPAHIQRYQFGILFSGSGAGCFFGCLRKKFFDSPGLDRNNTISSLFLTQ
jgi:hypothetical protein